MFKDNEYNVRIFSRDFPKLVKPISVKCSLLVKYWIQLNFMN